MFSKSIRFKITILYMAILALTLTSFSTILYHNVSSGLYSGMDTLLKSKAGGISQAVNTYWEASALEMVDTGVKSDALKKRRNTNFANTAQKWVKEESSDPALLNIIVRIFDTDGAIIASSKNTQSLTEIARPDFISVLQGRSRFDTLASDIKSNRLTLRIYTTPVFENEKVAYIVQIASPLAPIQIALNNIKVALFILFPITVLATGVIGAFLAKITLRPVDSMIHTIHQITAENMKLRLRVPDTKDEIQKLAETFNDMLKRLEGSFTSQRRLFENLSHELKTPLTILKGEFEVALKKSRPPDEYRMILTSSLEEINKIVHLAENLLFLAKVESKEAFPEKKRLDLGQLVRNIAAGIKRWGELKQVEVEIDSDSGVPIFGDEGQLKTLFVNIMDNAVKYTPSGGKISISVKNRNNAAVVEIHDTGMGIPKEEISHIFDRFYRVDKSRNSQGFGLGLSIARSIAEAHSAAITVESQLNSGTTFTVLFPLTK